jgi:UDP-N-acetylglucosamine 2-epimerase (non-hydrolysing)
MLAGTNPNRILKAAKTMINKNKNWTNPFGDGKTSQKIIKILKAKVP